MLLHFIRVGTDLVIDDLEHLFHILMLVRADLIALAVIESHGGARRTVGMDAGRSGSSPVADLRAFRLAHGEYIPDQGAFADSRHAADQDIGLADFALHQTESVFIIEILKVKLIHVCLLCFLLPGWRRQFQSAVLPVCCRQLQSAILSVCCRRFQSAVSEIWPQLGSRGLFAVIDPFLCRFFRDQHGVYQMLYAEGRIDMEQDRIAHCLHRRIHPAAFRQMHHDQLPEAAPDQGRTGRIIPAASVPIFKMMDPYGFIDQGKGTGRQGDLADFLYIPVVQTVIIRVMKRLQSILRGRLLLLLQALPGQAGKDHPVSGKTAFQDLVNDLRQLFLGKERFAGHRHHILHQQGRADGTDGCPCQSLQENLRHPLQSLLIDPGQILLTDRPPDPLRLFQGCAGKEDAVQGPDRRARDPCDLFIQTCPLQPSPDADLKGSFSAAAGQDQSVFSVMDHLQHLLCQDYIQEQADDFFPVSFQTDDPVLVTQ